MIVCRDHPPTTALTDLWGIPQIQSGEQLKVDETHKGSIELHKSQHDPKIHVSGHLKKGDASIKEGAWPSKTFWLKLYGVIHVTV